MNHYPRTEKYDQSMHITKDDLTLEPLNVDNWLKVCDLSVSKKQKAFFPIANVYWIGISRYEEKTELFAIQAGSDYVGLIGGGYDEDGVTGYINPLMIDQHQQGKSYGKQAMCICRRRCTLQKSIWGTKKPTMRQRNCMNPLASASSKI